MKLCPQCRSSYPDDYRSCPRDQAPLLAAPTEVAPGVILRGKYEVLSQLGAGGMATVYKVRHRAFQEIAAVKIVHSQFLHDPDFIKRFRNEAVVARQLKHPNAVRIDDFDYTDDGRPFIVMEFVDGRSLYELRKASPGPWPVERCLDIASQTAKALGAAHTLGIVHRDIKPANIILLRGPNGEPIVKVLDFGIAKVGAADAFAGMTSVLTQQSLVIGTPEYMSPEQASARLDTPIDGRSDLYSLGLVLYEMLTGAHPFQADTPIGMLIQQLNTQPAPPDSLGTAAISPAISGLVLKTLQKDPAHRFQSAAEMLAALHNPEAWYTTTLNPAAPPPEPLVPPPLATSAQSERRLPETASSPTPSPKPPTIAPAPRSSRTLYLILATAAAVLLAVGLWAIRRTQPHPQPTQTLLTQNPPTVPTPTPSTSAATTVPPSPTLSIHPTLQTKAPTPQAPPQPPTNTDSHSNSEAQPNPPSPLPEPVKPAAAPTPEPKPSLDLASIEDQYRSLHNSKQYAAALQFANDACARGSARECVHAGYTYDIGEGVPQDYAQSVVLYRKACAAGDIFGCSDLGVMYEQGHGVARDYAQAFTLLRKGCDDGVASGCSTLGHAYEAGNGVAQDYGQAVALFRKACDGGNASGCGNLGRMYQTGHGVPQDYNQAAALFRKACDAAFAVGCSNLGVAYQNGQGVARDTSQAIQLYRKACDANAAIGCANLAKMYEHGNGVSRDASQAIQLYRKACNSSYALACNALKTLSP